MSTQRKLFCLLALLCFSCQGPQPSRQAQRLLREQREDLTETASRKAIAAGARREERRREGIRELLNENALRTPEDLHAAAFVLVTSNDSADLEIARDLAFSAGEAGKQEALPVAAQAVDKLLMLRKLPQRFCTQYVYSPVLARWELYTWDVTVTDDDRLAMGVGTLREAQAKLSRLNDPAFLKAMRP